MKKFKFKLDPVLNLRKKEEDAIAQELALVQAERLRILNIIGNLDREIQSQYLIIKDTYANSIDINVIRMATQYLKSLKTRKVAAEADVKKKDEEILKIKDRLAEAMKKRKIIEKLKENKFEQYRDEFNKSDNITMDEMNNSRQGHKG
ncbi:MAG TPA: flagellar export protein FliJ [Candidatus Wallbacteria bacterium]|nr:flagellar export protein FliJ [Candidatus Wallbacteria bacterium]